MLIPEGQTKLTEFAVKVSEDCRVSQANRAAAYRQYAQWIETGSSTSTLALANLLYAHIDRLAAYLFSPTDLRFTIDFENHYPKEVMQQGAMASRVLTREWERKNIDVAFARGVKEALSFGGCLLKQLAQGDDGSPEVTARLVMPWHFGVYNEGVNGLAEQEAMVETVYLTKHEVWRRISRLPDAEKKYRRILEASNKGGTASLPDSFVHQVLSTAILDTTGTRGPTPGGIVQLSTQGAPQVSPQVAEDLIPFHEIWVKDDERDSDYTTIQLVEPDILIAPLYKRVNLFCPETQPYTLIQPNEVTNYFWGRAEIVDLMMLQMLLTNVLDDGKRLMGQQFEKLLAFPGTDAIQDEAYAKFRSTGVMGLPMGASVTDLTPKFPDNFIPFVGMIQQLMDKVSGFTNILSGEGEQGVRAGVHAETLVKTASPRLRDRALLVERQCAAGGDTTLAVLEAKKAKAFWTDADSGEDKDFLLSLLPDDRRVSVDSHSSSPVYQTDHQQLVAFGLKAGFIGGDSAIEMLPFPNKDVLVARWREMEAKKAQFIEQHPEVLKHPGAGKKH